MVHVGAQFWTKTLRFTLPIAEQADRCNDQGGLCQTTGLFLDQDVRQGLQGFTQAHVICQDAGQPVLPQKLQPVQALLLVGTQRGLQPGGHRHRRQGLLPPHVLHQAQKALRALPNRPLAQSHRTAQGFQARQTQTVALPIVSALTVQLHQHDQPRFDGRRG